jgi:hypothetical protein
MATGTAQPPSCTNDNASNMPRRQITFGLVAACPREHVRHNKRGITHLDRAKINYLRELSYQVKPLCSGGQVTLPSRTVML